MNKGLFAAQINSAERLLRDLKLFGQRNKAVTYPVDMPAVARSKPAYVDEYQYYLAERLFDFQLSDGALFVFRGDLPEDNVSYCFYPTPFDVPSYEAFLCEEFEIDAAAAADMGDAFMEDYQLAVDTARLRDTVTPIRYDYSPNIYEPGVHPASHVHIARRNDIRLGTLHRMMPMSFVLFVLRQAYPHRWRTFLAHEDAESHCKSVRDELDEVERKFLSSRDRMELYLA
jgi:hypothetical protein